MLGDMSETRKPEPRRALWTVVLCVGLMAVVCGVAVLVTFFVAGEVYWSAVPGLVGSLLGGGVCTYTAIHRLRTSR